MSSLADILDFSPDRYIHDPRQMFYLEYCKQVSTFTTALLGRVSLYLGRVLPNFPNEVALAVTGSDGRLENADISPLEVVLFYNSLSCSHEQAGILLDKLRSTFPIREHVQTISYGSDLKFAYWTTPSGKETASPNRIFDARYLFGDPELFEGLRWELFADIYDRDISLRVRESVSKKIQEAKHTICNGMSRGVPQFDMEKRKLYYDPQNGAFSVKPGPLRYLQHVLVYQKISYLKSLFGHHVAKLEDESYSRLHEPQIKAFLDLPSNTLAFLRAIDEITELSATELDELLDHYAYFLWLYHCSKKVYAEGEISMEFDATHARERMQRMMQLSSKKILKIA